ncbi:MAG: pantoate--beta-alanine ligase [Endomicrobia bacterium]|nr:pantoate--beta-alanine ligase [Endomicrobiia bacterium]
MKLVKKISLMQKVIENIKGQNKSIGLVPTMGALHNGHVELIKRARKDNDIVVVSIFVNPIQFGPKEDYKKYPRPIRKDLNICKNENVDFVFNPSVKEMYPRKYIVTYVEVEGIQDLLCGKFRQGHFKGVATVVAKLFNIINPTKAYFGEKDYQQLKIIQKMVEDLNFNVEIIPVATVREDDGLAYSSRNLYLSKEQRALANSIYKSLLFCRDLILKRKFKSLKKCISESKKYLNILLRDVEHYIQYFEIYNDELLPVSDDITKLPKNKKIRIFAAVYIGKTRLIDNVGFKV